MTKFKNSMMNWFKKVARVFFSPVQITLYVGIVVCLIDNLIIGSSNACMTAAMFAVIAVICFLKNIGEESFLLGIYVKICVGFSVLMGIAAVFALPSTPNQGDVLGFGNTLAYVFLAAFPWTLIFKPVGLTMIVASAFGLAVMGMEMASHDVATSALLLGLFAIATVLHAPAKVQEET